MLSECSGGREARDLRAFAKEGFQSLPLKSHPGKRKDKRVISSEQAVVLKLMNWSSCPRMVAQDSTWVKEEKRVKLIKRWFI